MQIIKNRTLFYMLNASFDEGWFLGKLKLSKIKLPNKIGEKSKVNNYRPASTLSYISKKFEKVMYIPDE